MAGHTPGPWEWWTSNSYRRLSSAVTGRDGGVLHGVVQSDGHPDVHLPNGGWDGPDGRLIAAAPVLLARLRECADDLEAEIRARYVLSDGTVHIAMLARYDRDMAPVKAARAAIAKAEGRP